MTLYFEDKYDMEVYIEKLADRIKHLESMLEDHFGWQFNE